MQIGDQNSNKKSNYEFNKIFFIRTNRRGKVITNRTTEL